MTRDQEIWACALAVEKAQGKDAVPFARMEIDRLDAEGKREASGVWRQVLERLEVLAVQAPSAQ